MPTPEQPALFELPEKWRDDWADMPAYDHENLAPWQTLKVHFRNEADRAAFAQVIGQALSDRTKFVWHPKAELAEFANKRWHASALVVPKYPVYIISKGRAESRLTSKALEAMRVPYSIVVEPQEFDAYAAVIDPAKILTLPFSNLGQGSIPARNWVWDHAQSTGATRHWILDDNIRGFYRLHDNAKIQCADPVPFVAIEDFADKFENVALCGMNYDFLAKRKFGPPAFVPNTRVYSCILIDNAIPYRWRGRYNEDTDLSLRALKDGYCTLLFNAFLAMKAATMTMKGGNTDELYKDDGRLKMAESLREQHPDVARVIWRFNRWQHYVDYGRFKRNKRIEVADPPPMRTPDMTLVINDDAPVVPVVDDTPTANVCEHCDGKGAIEITRDVSPSEDTGGMAEESTWVTCETCGGDGASRPAVEP
jgi:hypothetical protein